MALFGALAYLIPPLALNKITDYIDTYDEDSSDGGVPLIVVASVAGLGLGQVRLFTLAYWYLKKNDIL